MKPRFVILNILDATAIQLASVRSLLSTLEIELYIEINDVFYISCNTAFKEKIHPRLNALGISYILSHTHSKLACKVYSNGITIEDEDKLKAIIEK